LRCGGAGHGQSGRADLHFEVIGADVKHVFVLQDGVSDAQAIDPDAVQAIEVEDLPLALGKNKAAMATANFGGAEANVRLPMPANYHVRAVQLARGSLRLEQEPERQHVSRLRVRMVPMG